MRRFVGLILLFLQSVSGFDYPLTPVQVSSEVYCFFGAPQIMDSTNNGNISNSCYVDAGGRYIVIDTGLHPMRTQNQHMWLCSISKHSPLFC